MIYAGFIPEALFKLKLRCLRRVICKRAFVHQSAAATKAAFTHTGIAVARLIHICCSRREISNLKSEMAYGLRAMRTEQAASCFPWEENLLDV